MVAGCFPISRTMPSRMASSVSWKEEANRSVAWSSSGEGSEFVQRGLGVEEIGHIEVDAQAADDRILAVSQEDG